VIDGRDSLLSMHVAAGSLALALGLAAMLSERTPHYRSRVCLVDPGVDQRQLPRRPLRRIPALRARARGGVRRLQIAALTGVAERESGLAAGLVDSAFHVGAALGIAVVTTVAVARTEEVLGDGSAQLNAITEGFQAAFMVAVVFAIVGALAALAFLRRGASAQTAPPSVAAVPEPGAELN
jgi:hypothetical protein